MTVPKDLGTGSMAQPHGSFDGLLELARTQRWRSTVYLAAISFAICHFIVLSTAPFAAEIASDSDPDLQNHLIHLAAELCRFALPLGFTIGGLVAYARAKRARLSLIKANTN
jgi:hypothetical protein